MENQEYVIRLEHVYKNFGSTEILKDLSLRCEKGRIYGFIGYNGSGKTVLFKCICGFYKCTKGEIYINGRQMGKDMDMLDQAGIIIEEPGFLRKWDGYHNLEFLYTIRNKKDKKYLYEVMEKVGLDPKSKKKVEKYSLGMRQRLAIAQAIVEDPDILILDEPMNGLDKEGVAEMRSLFLEMKATGKTILLASHNREDIEALCDEVYDMENMPHN